ncbi:MAG: hypothetical protein ACHREM_24740, partial [Polyangiales bacterium]
MPPPAPPYGPLRARALVRAMPAMWCVGFSVLGGVEIFHLDRHAGRPFAVCVASAIATAVIASVKTLLVLFITTREMPRLWRLVGAPAAVGFGNAIFAIVGMSLTSRYEASFPMSSGREIEFVNSSGIMPFVGASAIALVGLLVIELPFIGAIRQTRGKISAESIDDALLLFGVGTVLHCIAFRAATSTHVDVAIALVACAVVGGWLARVAQSRRVARRRWLAEVASDRDPDWQLRPVEDVTTLGRSLEMLVDDGDSEFVLVARSSDLDAYRASPDGFAAPAARVRARSDVIADAKIWHLAAGLSVLWSAFASAVTNPREDSTGESTNARNGDLTAPQFVGCLGVVVILVGSVLVWTSRNLMHTHNAEATRNLGSIEAGLKAYASAHHEFPVSGAPV